MRITSRPDQRVGEHTVVSADVTWEDCDRKNRTIYACVPAAIPAAGHAEWLTLSTAFIAARYGERRVRLDRPIDPLVHRGLSYAMEQLRVWYGAPSTVVEGEPPDVADSTGEVGTRAAAVLVSGGVDSWAALVRWL